MILQCSLVGIITTGIFLDVDMGKTKEVIAYISPLLFLVDQELEEFITR